MRGKPCLGAAEMPLTPSTGSVAARGQQLRDRDLPQRQPVRNAAKRDFVCARADGKATRHERRPTGRALRLDIEVEQPHAFACEVVDTRRRRTAKDATAVRGGGAPYARYVTVACWGMGLSNAERQRRWGAVTLPEVARAPARRRAVLADVRPEADRLGGSACGRGEPSSLACEGGLMHSSKKHH